MIHHVALKLFLFTISSSLDIPFSTSLQKISAKHSAIYTLNSKQYAPFASTRQDFSSSFVEIIMGAN